MVLSDEKNNTFFYYVIVSLMATNSSFNQQKNVIICIEAQNNDLNAIHINTVNRTPEEIVKEIIEKACN